MSNDEIKKENKLIIIIKYQSMSTFQTCDSDR
jgi:hypothetical protein